MYVALKFHRYSARYMGIVNAVVQDCFLLVVLSILPGLIPYVLFPIGLLVLLLIGTCRASHLRLLLFSELLFENSLFNCCPYKIDLRLLPVLTPSE